MCISFHLYFISFIFHFGSLVITPTRNCTHFLKIGFVVAGGGFIPIIGNKSDKKEKL